MGGEADEKNGREFWDATISMTPPAHKFHTVSQITSPYESYLLDITVLLVCFNHQESIINTLNSLIEALGVINKTFEILIIDDGSSDNSVELLRDYLLQNREHKIVLRVNKKRKGIAQNYVDGAFIGCGKYYLMLPAVNCEPLETLADILNAVGDADIIVPYYVSMKNNVMGPTADADHYRSFINLISGNRINCYTSSHVHLRYNIMRWQVNSQGWAFQTDILCRLLDLGFTCKQVPCRALPVNPTRLSVYSLGHFLSVCRISLDIIFRRLAHWVNY